MLKSQVKIDDLIGKPFKQKGRGPDNFDCSGLCMEVSRRLGGELPELKEIIQYEFMPLDKPELGALVLINTDGTRHVGIMLDKRNMLQINNDGKGVHKIRVNNPWIKNRIIGYYKYVG